MIAMRTQCLIIALTAQRPKSDDIVLQLMQELRDWIALHQWQHWLDIRMVTSFSTDMASDLLGRDLVIFIDCAPDIAERCYWQTILPIAPADSITAITSPNHLLWHCHTLGRDCPAELYQIRLQSNTLQIHHDSDKPAALIQAWTELQDFLRQRCYAYPE
jgi:hypothetical protein